MNKILEKVNVFPTIYGGGFLGREFDELDIGTELAHEHTEFCPGMRLLGLCTALW